MNEAALRLGVFLAVLCVLLAAQSRWPRRPLAGTRTRWPVNLAFVTLDTVVVRLVAPAGAVGVAVAVQREGFGLLHHLAWPYWLEFALAFLALDALIYWQHRIFHKLPLLWRLHRMHHSDVEFDATTGVRFHPAEIVLSMLIKMAAVALLGAPAAAVVAFEIALNATSMFSHANLHLPQSVDRILRRVLVTPDMHRVHHSTYRDEHDANFGFNLSCWDRLFGSYVAQPREGHAAMTIGLTQFREPAAQRLAPLLKQPLEPL